MLYQTYLFLLSDFSVGKVIAILVLLGLIGSVVWAGAAQLFRWALVPAVLIEAYLMSPGYACSHGGIFKRADAVSGMCQDAPYNAYLNQNFGLNLWYIQALYFALFLFAIWSAISRGLSLHDDKEFQDKSRKKQAKEYAEYRDRISRVEKIGPM